MDDYSLVDDKAQVVCNFFQGTLKEFKKAVLEDYKDNEILKNQYLKEIAKAKVLFGLKDIDAIPVVRCKDCEFAEEKNHPDIDWETPIDEYVCRVHHEIFKSNDFCSYGERRGERDD